MTPRLLETVLREAAARAADGSGGSLPDGDLLTRYAVDRDESAFTALVARHGRIVWAVCRQSLPNECDAEDAFQATFLALARSASTVRSSLPGWLHGTAVKICAQARRTAGRRKVRESNAAVREADRPVADSTWDGLLAEVHAEVTRLPATLRDAFVLVDLEGVSQADAAKSLGWKAGTLTGRLCQARQLLVDRLSARGVASAAALTGCGLGAVASSAAVPSTIFAAACAVGKTGATIPAAVSLLAAAANEGVVLMKTKLLAAGIMVTVAAAITVVSAQVPGGAGGNDRTPPNKAARSGDANQNRDRAPRAGGDTGGGAGMGGPGMPGGQAPGVGGMMPGGPGAPAGSMAGMGMGMSGMASGSSGPVRPGFEYKIITFGAAFNDSGLQKQFDDLGRDNWELVAVTPNGNQSSAIFKRSKPVAMGAGGGRGTGGPAGMMGGPGGGFNPIGGGEGGGGFGGSMGGPGGFGPTGGVGDPRGAGPGGPGGAPRNPDNRPNDGGPRGGAPGGRGGAAGPGGMGSPDGGGGPRGGMSGLGGSFGGGRVAAKPVITTLDTPLLEPKKVAQTINQLFNERGVNAIEAPDGKGVIITSESRDSSAIEEIKGLVAKYVDKAGRDEAVRKAEEQKQRSDAERKRDDANRKKGGEA